MITLFDSGTSPVGIDVLKYYFMTSLVAVEVTTKIRPRSSYII